MTPPGAPAPDAPRALRAWALVEPLVAAVLGVYVLTFVVATLRLHAFPLTASDFEQYCVAVDGIRRWDLRGWPPQRSAAAALLPGLLARGHGTVPGLVHATLLSMVVLLGALFTWARHVGGRRAGWLAVAWAPCAGPLVVLGRTVTFYPEMAAAQAVAAASLAGALARGARAWKVAAAVSLAALPLLDVRGVLLALAYLPVAMLAGARDASDDAGAEGDTPSATPPPARWARPATWRRAAWSLLPLAALAASWVAGRWAQPSAEGTLQRAVAAHVRDAAGAVQRAWPIPSPETGEGFAWGHGGAGALLDALAYVRAVEAARPPGLRALALDRAAAYEAWTLRGLAAAGLVAALAAGARRPRAIAALVLPGLPLAVLLWNAMTTLPHARQLALSAAVFPVVMGVGSAALLALFDTGRNALARMLRRRVGDRAAARVEHRAWRWITLAVVMLMLARLWTGAQPSRLAPDAWWREIILSDVEPRSSLDTARAATRGADARTACDVILARDRTVPGGLDIPWFPSARPAPRYLPERLR